jgi:hypothetical protein
VATLMLLLLLLLGCTEDDRNRAEVSEEEPPEQLRNNGPDKWVPLKVWESGKEGSVMSDIDIPTKEWRLIIENTGDDLVMVGVADANGRDVAMGTATEKPADTLNILNSKGIHKIAVGKIGEDGPYKVTLETRRR